MEVKVTTKKKKNYWVSKPKPQKKSQKISGSQVNFWEVITEPKLRKSTICLKQTALQ